MPLLTPHVPNGLIDLMKDLAKEVLRDKPENIYEFAAVHFEKLIQQRDGSMDKGYEQFLAYDTQFKGQQRFAIPCNSGYSCQRPIKVQPVLQPRKSKSDMMASFKAMESINEEDVTTENLYNDEKYQKAIYVIQRYYRRYAAKKREENLSSITLTATTAAIIIQRTMRKLFANKIKLKTTGEGDTIKRDGTIQDDVDNVSEAASYTSASTIQMLPDSREGGENRLLGRVEVSDGGGDDVSTEVKEQTTVAAQDESSAVKEEITNLAATQMDKKSIADENGNTESLHEEGAPLDHPTTTPDDTSTAHIGILSTKIGNNDQQNSLQTNTVEIDSNSSDSTQIQIHIPDVVAVGNFPLNYPQSLGATPDTFPATSPQSEIQEKPFAVRIQDNVYADNNTSYPYPSDAQVRKYDPVTRESLKIYDVFYQDRDDPDFSDSLNESTMERDSLENEDLDVDSLESNESAMQHVKREIKEDDGSLYEDAADVQQQEEDHDAQGLIEVERMPSYLYGIHPSRTPVVERKNVKNRNSAESLKNRETKDMASALGLGMDERSPEEKSEEASLDSKGSTSEESSATQIENVLEDQEREMGYDEDDFKDYEAVKSHELDGDIISSLQGQASSGNVLKVLKSDEEFKAEEGLERAPQSLKHALQCNEFIQGEINALNQEYGSYEADHSARKRNVGLKSPQSNSVEQGGSEKEQTMLSATKEVTTHASEKPSSGLDNADQEAKSRDETKDVIVSTKALLAQPRLRSEDKDSTKDSFESHQLDATPRSQVFIQKPNEKPIDDGDKSLKDTLLNEIQASDDQAETATHRQKRSLNANAVPPFSENKDVEQQTSNLSDNMETIDSSSVNVKHIPLVTKVEKAEEQFDTQARLDSKKAQDNENKVDAGKAKVEERNDLSNWLLIDAIIPRPSSPIGYFASLYSGQNLSRPTSSLKGNHDSEVESQIRELQSLNNLYPGLEIRDIISEFHSKDIQPDERRNIKDREHDDNNNVEGFQMKSEDQKHSDSSKQAEATMESLDNDKKNEGKNTTTKAAQEIHPDRGSKETMDIQESSKESDIKKDFKPVIKPDSLRDETNGMTPSDYPAALGVTVEQASKDVKDSKSIEETKEYIRGEDKVEADTEALIAPLSPFDVSVDKRASEDELSQSSKETSKLPEPKTDKAMQNIQHDMSSSSIFETPSPVDSKKALAAADSAQEGVLSPRSDEDKVKNDIKVEVSSKDHLDDDVQNIDTESDKDTKDAVEVFSSKAPSSKVTDDRKGIIKTEIEEPEILKERTTLVVKTEPKDDHKLQVEPEVLNESITSDVQTDGISKLQGEDFFGNAIDKSPQTANPAIDIVKIEGLGRSTSIRRLDSLPKVEEETDDSEEVSGKVKDFHSEQVSDNKEQDKYSSMQVERSALMGLGQEKISNAKASDISEADTPSSEPNAAKMTSLTEVEDANPYVIEETGLTDALRKYKNFEESSNPNVTEETSLTDALKKFKNVEESSNPYVTEETSLTDALRKYKNVEESSNPYVTEETSLTDALRKYKNIEESAIPYVIEETSLTDALKSFKNKSSTEKTSNITEAEDNENKDDRNNIKATIGDRVMESVTEDISYQDSDTKHPDSNENLKENGSTGIKVENLATKVAIEDKNPRMSNLDILEGLKTINEALTVVKVKKVDSDNRKSTDSSDASPGKDDTSSVKYESVEHSDSEKDKSHKPSEVDAIDLLEVRNKSKDMSGVHEKSLPLDNPNVTEETILTDALKSSETKYSAEKSSNITETKENENKDDRNNKLISKVTAAISSDKPQSTDSSDASPGKDDTSSVKYERMKLNDSEKDKNQKQVVSNKSKELSGVHENSLSSANPTVIEETILTDTLKTFPSKYSTEKRSNAAETETDENDSNPVASNKKLREDDSLTVENEDLKVVRHAIKDKTPNISNADSLELKIKNNSSTVADIEKVDSDNRQSTDSSNISPRKDGTSSVKFKSMDLSGSEKDKKQTTLEEDAIGVLEANTKGLEMAGKDDSNRVSKPTPDSTSDSLAVKQDNLQSSDSGEAKNKHASDKEHLEELDTTTEKPKAETINSVDSSGSLIGEQRDSEKSTNNQASEIDYSEELKTIRESLKDLVAPIGSEALETAQKETDATTENFATNRSMFETESLDNEESQIQSGSSERENISHDDALKPEKPIFKLGTSEQSVTSKELTDQTLNKNIELINGKPFVEASASDANVSPDNVESKEAGEGKLALEGKVPEAGLLEATRDLRDHDSSKSEQSTDALQVDLSDTSQGDNKPESEVEFTRKYVSPQHAEAEQLSDVLETNIPIVSLTKDKLGLQTLAPETNTDPSIINSDELSDRHEVSEERTPVEDKPDPEILPPGANTYDKYPQPKNLSEVGTSEADTIKEKPDSDAGAIGSPDQVMPVKSNLEASVTDHTTDQQLSHDAERKTLEANLITQSPGLVTKVVEGSVSQDHPVTEQLSNGQPSLDVKVLPTTIDRKPVLEAHTPAGCEGKDEQLGEGKPVLKAKVSNVNLDNDKPNLDVTENLINDKRDLESEITKDGIHSNQTQTGDGVLAKAKSFVEGKAIRENSKPDLAETEQLDTGTLIQSEPALEIEISNEANQLDSIASSASMPTEVTNCDESNADTSADFSSIGKNLDFFEDTITYLKNATALLGKMDDAFDDEKEIKTPQPTVVVHLAEDLPHNDEDGIQNQGQTELKPEAEKSNENGTNVNQAKYKDDLSRAAIIIQSAVRGYQARRVLNRKSNETDEFTKRAKRSLVSEVPTARDAMRHAAIIIQSAIRGYRVRRALNERHTKSELISVGELNNSAQNDVKTVGIQEVRKSNKTDEFTKKAKRSLVSENPATGDAMRHAAVIIQSAIRGYRVRRALNERHTKSELTSVGELKSSAQKDLQSVGIEEVRKSNKTDEFTKKAKRSLVPEDPATGDALRHAAIIIQSAIRGYRVRRALNERHTKSELASVGESARGGDNSSAQNDIKTVGIGAVRTPEPTKGRLENKSEKHPTPVAVIHPTKHLPHPTVVVHLAEDLIDEDETEYIPKPDPKIKDAKPAKEDTESDLKQNDISLDTESSSTQQNQIVDEVPAVRQAIRPSTFPARIKREKRLERKQGSVKDHSLNQTPQQAEPLNRREKPADRKVNIVKSMSLDDTRQAKTREKNPKSVKNESLSGTKPSISREMPIERRGKAIKDDSLDKTPIKPPSPEKKKKIVKPFERDSQIEKSKPLRSNQRKPTSSDLVQQPRVTNNKRNQFARKGRSMTINEQTQKENVFDLEAIKKELLTKKGKTPPQSGRKVKIPAKENRSIRTQGSLSKSSARTDVSTSKEKNDSDAIDSSKKLLDESRDSDTDFSDHKKSEQLSTAKLKQKRHSDGPKSPSKALEESKKSAHSHKSDISQESPIDSSEQNGKSDSSSTLKESLNEALDQNKNSDTVDSSQKSFSEPLDINKPFDASKASERSPRNLQHSDRTQTSVELITEHPSAFDAATTLASETVSISDNLKKDIEKSATTIQKTFRGYRARKNFPTIPTKLTKEGNKGTLSDSEMTDQISDTLGDDSALDTSTIIRANQDESQVLSELQKTDPKIQLKKMEKDNDQTLNISDSLKADIDDLRNVLQNSATKIQKTFRGYKTRKDLRKTDQISDHSKSIICEPGMTADISDTIRNVPALDASTIADSQKADEKTLSGDQIKSQKSKQNEMKEEERSQSENIFDTLKKDIDHLKNSVLEKSATTIQKTFRGYKTRKDLSKTDQISDHSKNVIYEPGMKADISDTIRNEPTLDSSTIADSQRAEEKTLSGDQIKSQKSKPNEMKKEEGSGSENMSILDNLKKDVDDFKNAVLEKSATTIQKTFRGYKTRKDLSKTDQISDHSKSVIYEPGMKADISDTIRNEPTLDSSTITDSQNTEEKAQSGDKIKSQKSKHNEMKEEEGSRSENMSIFDNLKKDVDEFKNAVLEKSATTIQKTFRGYKTRKDLRKPEEVSDQTVRETRNAENGVKIVDDVDKIRKTLIKQVDTPVYNTRNMNGVEGQKIGVFDSFDVEEFQNAALQKSATTIQKTFRGYKTRKELLNRKVEEDELLEKEDESNKMSDNEAKLIEESKTLAEKSHDNQDSSTSQHSKATDTERDTKASSGEDKKILEKAAVTIQKTYKGYKTRKDRLQHPQEVDEKRDQKMSIGKVEVFKPLKEAQFDTGDDVEKKDKIGLYTKQKIHEDPDETKSSKSSKVAVHMADEGIPEDVTSSNKDQKGAIDAQLFNNQNIDHEAPTASSNVVKTTIKAISAGALLEKAASTIQKAYRDYQTKKDDVFSKSPIKSYSHGAQRDKSFKEAVENSDESSTFIGPDTSFDLSDVESEKQILNPDRRNSTETPTQMHEDEQFDELDLDASPTFAISIHSEGQDQDNDSPKAEETMTNSSLFVPQGIRRKRSIIDPTAPLLEDILNADGVTNDDQKPLWYVGDDLIIPTETTNLSTEPPTFLKPLASSSSIDKLSSVDARNENLNSNNLQLTQSINSAVVSTSSLLFANDTEMHDIDPLNKHSRAVSANKEEANRFEETEDKEDLVNEEKKSEEVDARIEGKVEIENLEKDEEDLSNGLAARKETSYLYSIDPFAPRSPRREDVNEKEAEDLQEIVADLCKNCADGIHEGDIAATLDEQKSFETELSKDTSSQVANVEDTKDDTDSAERHFDEIKQFVLMEDSSPIVNDKESEKVNETNGNKNRDDTEMSALEKAHKEENAEKSVDTQVSDISNADDVNGALVVGVHILDEDSREIQHQACPSISFIPPSSEDDVSDNESIHESKTKVGREQSKDVKKGKDSEEEIESKPDKLGESSPSAGISNDNLRTEPNGEIPSQKQEGKTESVDVTIETDASKESDAIVEPSDSKTEEEKKHGETAIEKVLTDEMTPLEGDGNTKLIVKDKSVENGQKGSQQEVHTKLDVTKVSLLPESLDSSKSTIDGALERSTNASESPEIGEDAFNIKTEQETVKEDQKFEDDFNESVDISLANRAAVEDLIHSTEQTKLSLGQSVEKNDKQRQRHETDNGVSKAADEPSMAEGKISKGKSSVDNDEKTSELIKDKHTDELDSSLKDVKPIAHSGKSEVEIKLEDKETANVERKDSALEPTSTVVDAKKGTNDTGSKSTEKEIEDVGREPVKAENLVEIKQEKPTLLNEESEEQGTSIEKELKQELSMSAEKDLSPEAEQKEVDQNNVTENPDDMKKEIESTSSKEKPEASQDLKDEVSPPPEDLEIASKLLKGSNELENKEKEIESTSLEEKTEASQGLKDDTTTIRKEVPPPEDLEIASKLFESSIGLEEKEKQIESASPKEKPEASQDLKDDTTTIRKEEKVPPPEDLEIASKLLESGIGLEDKEKEIESASLKEKPEASQDLKDDTTTIRKEDKVPRPEDLEIASKLLESSIRLVDKQNEIEPTSLEEKTEVSQDLKKGDKVPPSEDLEIVSKLLEGSIELKNKEKEIESTSLEEKTEESQDLKDDTTTIRKEDKVPRPEDLEIAAKLLEGSIELKNKEKEIESTSLEEKTEESQDLKDDTTTIRKEDKVPRPEDLEIAAKLLEGSIELKNKEQEIESTSLEEKTEESQDLKDDTTTIRKEGKVPPPEDLEIASKLLESSIRLENKENDIESTSLEEKTEESQDLKDDTTTIRKEGKVPPPEDLEIASKLLESSIRLENKENDIESTSLEEKTEESQDLKDDTTTIRKEDKVPRPEDLEIAAKLLEGSIELKNKEKEIESTSLEEKTEESQDLKDDTTTIRKEDKVPRPEDLEIAAKLLEGSIELKNKEQEIESTSLEEKTEESQDLKDDTTTIRKEGKVPPPEDLEIASKLLESSIRLENKENDIESTSLEEKTEESQDLKDDTTTIRKEGKVPPPGDLEIASKLLKGSIDLEGKEIVKSASGEPKDIIGVQDSIKPKSSSEEKGGVDSSKGSQDSPSSLDLKIQANLEKLIEDNKPLIEYEVNTIDRQDLPTENATEEIIEVTCIKKIIPPTPLSATSDQDESELESTTTKADSTSTTPGYDDASENEIIEIPPSLPDNLEAMTEKIRETEAMVARMHQRRASEHKISTDSTEQPPAFDEPICEPIKPMQELQKSSSIDTEDDIILQKLQRSDTTRESSAQSESVIFGETTSQLTESDDTFNENFDLKTLHRMNTIAADRSTYKPPGILFKSVTIDDTVKYIDPEKSTEDSGGSFCMDDVMSADVRKKIMAYSVSEADSDYYDVGDRTSRPHDDFNISTALDTFPSSDTDTTIVSAATKIQAGARGFLTRRRLRRASMGTKSSLTEETKTSFGNDAIGESLDRLVEEEVGKRMPKVQYHRQVGVNSLPSALGNSDEQETTVHLSPTHEEIHTDDESNDLKLDQLTAATTTTQPHGEWSSIDGQGERHTLSTSSENDVNAVGIEEEDESAQVPSNLEATLAARRLTLQRGDAMRNDSTPDDDNSNGKQVDLGKNIPATTDTTLIHQKTMVESTITTTTTTTTTERRNYSDAATSIKMEKVKWFAMRQNSMPVQIDSEVFRVLPKHMRKRIKSADGEKKKRIRLPRD